MRRIAVAALVLGVRALQAQSQEPAPDGPITSFGVTVVDAYGLHGEIYLIKPGSRGLPNFRSLKTVGSIYTYALNIPPTDFTAGFPGVTDRFEWFAIDYNGSFWVPRPGEYRFRLGSDDGSRLFVDGKRIIDNNGLHPIVTKTGSVTLKAGFHKMRVQYFQGPRMHIALQLGVAGPGDQNFRVFNTHEFRPANDTQ